MSKNSLFEALLPIMEKCINDARCRDLEGWHPAFDIEFLEDLIAGALPEEKLEEYREHLAQCPLCRDEMALHARCGTLQDAQRSVMPMQPSRPAASNSAASNSAASNSAASNSAASNSPASNSPASNSPASNSPASNSPASRSETCHHVRARAWFSFLGLATCGGLAMLCAPLLMQEQDPEKKIANMLESQIAPKESSDVLEQTPGASEQDSDFLHSEYVTEAPQAVPSEFSDTQNDLYAKPKEEKIRILRELRASILPEDRMPEWTLAALGFPLCGQSSDREFPPMDARLQNLNELFRVALANDPEEAGLYLEYAAFLLYTADQPELAKQVLETLPAETLNDRQKRDCAKLTALTLFTLRKFEEAVPYFEEAAQASQQTADKLDLAAALYAAEEKERALTLLRELKEEVTAPETLRQIQRVIEETSENSKPQK